MTHTRNLIKRERVVLVHLLQEVEAKKIQIPDVWEVLLHVPKLAADWHGTWLHGSAVKDSRVVRRGVDAPFSCRPSSIPVMTVTSPSSF